MYIVRQFVERVQLSTRNIGLLLRRAKFGQAFLLLLGALSREKLSLTCR